MKTSMTEFLNKNNLLIWAAIVPLAICLIYSLFYLALGRILSHTLDVAVWGAVIFIVLFRLGINLESNMIKGYYRSYFSVGLLVTICAMATTVVSVILDFFSAVVFVPISLVLLGLCVVFSPDFFGLDRVPFVLRLLAGGLTIGLLVALVVFVF
jgi:hypothetical protein